MRKSMFLICILFIFNTYPQENKAILFVDYKHIINDITQNSDRSQIANKYDLASVLILDSTELNTILKIDSSIINDFKEYRNALHTLKNLSSFQTKEMDIKQFFVNHQNQNQLKEIILRNKQTQISFPIYIKENSVVFNVFYNSWSATYYAKLEEGKIIAVKLVEGID